MIFLMRTTNINKNNSSINRTEIIQCNNLSINRTGIIQWLNYICTIFQGLQLQINSRSPRSADFDSSPSIVLINASICVRHFEKIAWGTICRKTSQSCSETCFNRSRYCRSCTYILNLLYEWFFKRHRRSFIQKRWGEKRKH